MEKYAYPVMEPDIGEKELLNVLEAVKSGWVGSKGRFVAEFEDSFAKYNGLKKGIATSSGTAALHLALTGLGIGPGDEVILPDLTFAATINAVIYTGAKPVIVDVSPAYWAIDISKIALAITSRTKAIIPVHIYGHPCDMDPLMDLARQRGILVIEDCAEAHGAEYKGKKVGSFGDVACFSFYANKIITTGEGGMCLTNDTELAEKMRILHDHGMNPQKKYWHELVGFNYRMTNLQAALGVAQIERIDAFIEKKRRVARMYNEELSSIDGIMPHPEMPWAKCVYWLYSILLDESKVKVTRDQLAEDLGSWKIETRNIFSPIHSMPPYQKYTSSIFPISSTISDSGLSLPSSTKLVEQDIIFVTNHIRKSLTN